ncbi:alpha/beta hydrolase [Oceanobacillus bengalensis]|uniref:Alpha/beta hydrolase n=1 Tax=Oceanobacillus bengalensis TaxID=1435466 RepID=A0A494Z6G7_9BACI|nr:alpha/beta hydrolase [Oceanobacillus bengalensis]RKQ18151.1 alpha/beta hydrolase [Oceanobacillus bengalensis]
MLKVKQKKIEVLRKGNKGKTIIILTGMGCSFDEWHNITETLSETNRVVMFHRPGLGESEIGNEVRNTEAVVKELLDLMSVLEITEPIILVGHSYGGLCAQHFAKCYPQKIAGIVLVDSTSVDLQELDELDLPVLDRDEADEVWLEKCTLYSSLEQEQLRGIIHPILSEKLKSIPKEVQQRLLDFQTRPSLYKAMYSEISNWKQDAKVIKSLETTLNVPLIVLGRDKAFSIKIGIQDGLPEKESRAFEEKWQELITRQGKLSNDSNILLVRSSSHSIHIDRPDIVIQSISEIANRLLKVN